MQDLVIVFIGHRYGIFHVAEYITLCGLVLNEFPSALESPLEVFRRFNLDPPP